jgi:hypothetical protein
MKMERWRLGYFGMSDLTGETKSFCVVINNY